MKIIGIKSVRIKSLLLPGDLKERIESPRNVELSDLMHTVGVVHEPLVRHDDAKLITGADTVAQAIIAGLHSISVKLVECDDDELDALRATEFADPVSRTERLAALAAKRAQRITDSGETPKRQGSRGRPRTARGIAREQIALERGIKPETVRQAEYRARRAGKSAPPVQRGTVVEGRNVPIVLTELGVPAPDAFHQNAAQLIDKLTEVGNLLSNQILPGIKAAQRLGYPEPWAAVLHDKVSEVSAFVRERIPESMCPYCKNLAGARENCPACVTTGWVGRSVLKYCSSEMLQIHPDRCLVYTGSDTYELKEFLATHPQPEQDQPGEPAPAPAEEEDLF